MGQKKTKDITSDMIQKFVLKRSKISAHVANKEIRYLKALFNMLKNGNGSKKTRLMDCP